MTIIEQLSSGRVWQQGGQRNRERLVVPERNRSCTAFPTSYYLYCKSIPYCRELRKDRKRSVSVTLPMIFSSGFKSPSKATHYEWLDTTRTTFQIGKKRPKLSQPPPDGEMGESTEANAPAQERPEKLERKTHQ
uniref:Uncharacterized protein n=1 Tax=Heterorhabditis bacteriophora TaxID=37862 RepID=A0A1I7WEP1_HETBA